MIFLEFQLKYLHTNKQTNSSSGMTFSIMKTLKFTIYSFDDEQYWIRLQSKFTFVSLLFDENLGEKTFVSIYKLWVNKYSITRAGSSYKVEIFLRCANWSSHVKQKLSVKTRHTTIVINEIHRKKSWSTILINWAVKLIHFYIFPIVFFPNDYHYDLHKMFKACGDNSRSFRDW